MMSKPDRLPVLLRCYFRQNSPGEVCGLAYRDAVSLVKQGKASPVIKGWPEEALEDAGVGSKPKPETKVDKQPEKAEKESKPEKDKQIRAGKEVTK